jgi:hypothetical protein
MLYPTELRARPKLLKVKTAVPSTELDFFDAACMKGRAMIQKTGHPKRSGGRFGSKFNPPCFIP